jgi:hypothetical protein
MWLKRASRMTCRIVLAFLSEDRLALRIDCARGIGAGLVSRVVLSPALCSRDANELDSSDNLSISRDEVACASRLSARRHARPN